MTQTHEVSKYCWGRVLLASLAGRRVSTDLPIEGGRSVSEHRKAKHDKAGSGGTLDSSIEQLCTALRASAKREGDKQNRTWSLTLD